ncbi:MAG: FAD-dependent oxidoreductase [Alphaproteobacteria bacterium]|nr:FAD-dependent oxidoreductase [Alphaproteobacteria bacterium]
MSRDRIVIVGAGMGGLAAAVSLASRGEEVLVVERQAAPGGKMRRLDVAGRGIDGGPTVFTMRWVLEQLFDEAGASISDHVTLEPLSTLARHAWSESERLSKSSIGRPIHRLSAASPSC